MKPIEIFKPGTHTASNGIKLDFSESDLKASAAAYDPAKFEAPIVIGHPKTEHPRYGGIKSLSYGDGILAGIPGDVDPTFAEWVDRKFYNNVSGSFYTPDSPYNPVPGVYYLRHLGFLGAQPPSIKGLNPGGIHFSDNEEGVLEFGDWGDIQNASILRSLREWIISKFSLADADQAIPGYAVTSVEQDALQDDPDDGNDPGVTPSSFSENQPRGDEMYAEEKTRLAALEAENAALKKQNADRRLEQINAGNAAFAETLVKSGKLLPAQRGVCVATLNFFEGREEVVEFSEGDVKAPIHTAFKKFLEALPKQVEYKEVAGGEDVGAPADDAVSIALAAADFMESESKAGRTVSSAAAVRHVQKELSK